MLSSPRAIRSAGASEPQRPVAVAVAAERRRRILRPPLALERLTESSGGQLLYQFRRAWRDGSTALLLDPLELLERLAALVPPPRRPLLAYHGVLAPQGAATLCSLSAAGANSGICVEIDERIRRIAALLRGH